MSNKWPTLAVEGDYVLFGLVISSEINIFHPDGIFGALMGHSFFDTDSEPDGKGSIDWWAFTLGRIMALM